MQYFYTYQSPIGEMLLTADENYLTGVWFTGSKFYPKNAKSDALRTPIIEQTIQWLDTYFQGEEPNFLPPLNLHGTRFQSDVWEILRAIPYGQTTTYGKIAKQLAAKYGISRVSAQAVGQAVGRNPISIIVPCHRVVGANGSLIGYAAGLDKKSFLLALEGIEV